jgi:ketosteroid isomerase-like protein
MEGEMAFLGPIEDQLAIRALHDSYSDAVFRRDADQWGGNWAEDGRWHLMGTTVEGRDSIVGLWNGAMGGFAFVAFFSQCAAIEIDGDTATGRVFTHEVLEGSDGTLSRPVGRYDDHYVKRDGRWLYQERRYTLLKG